MLKTLHLAQAWFNKQNIRHADARVIDDGERTPILLIEIEATDPAIEGTTLLYGHLDKQPEAEGWDANKGPFTPVLENDKLYGRGSADDGYAFFTEAAAIKALQENGVPHGRCVILIETGEESGSLDLAYYLETFKDVIKEPSLIICLDSGAGNYEKLWITASLRGTVVGRLTASLLEQGIHSGNSGKAASSFRILRLLLNRIEDAETGEILLPEFHTEIPENRRRQIRETAVILEGQIRAALPFVKGGLPMADSTEALIINSSWKPMLSYIGADGLPPVLKSSNTLRPYTTLMLSIRIPPLTDSKAAAEKLKAVLEEAPPYGARVKYDLIKHAPGWNMPDLRDALSAKISRAAEEIYGAAPGYMGEGGSIPFMSLLAQKFPEAKFFVSGVLGPHSNAHGPNEFLHIPYVKKLTEVIARTIGSF